MTYSIAKLPDGNYIVMWSKLGSDYTNHREFRTSSLAANFLISIVSNYFIYPTTDFDGSLN